MGDDTALLAIGATAFCLMMGAILGTSIYTAHLRQECVFANAQRGAGDVIAICGKP